MRWTTLVLVAILTGCDPTCSDPERVTLVHLGKSIEKGDIDDYSIIEWESDGVRGKIPYHYGKVGDKFKKRRHAGTSSACR